jgi:hypothetical protein
MPTSEVAHVKCLPHSFAQEAMFGLYDEDEFARPSLSLGAYLLSDCTTPDCRSS